MIQFDPTVVDLASEVVAISPTTKRAILHMAGSWLSLESFLFPMNLKGPNSKLPGWTSDQIRGGK